MTRYIKSNSSSLYHRLVTRRIFGFKNEVSNYLFKFVYNHIALSTNSQCQVKWENGTVVVWDERATAHSAILDWRKGQRRILRG